MLSNFTDNRSPRTLASETPAYVINKLANVIRKPNTSHPRYTAFHGPTANASFIHWKDNELYKIIYGGIKRDYIGYNLLSLWQDTTPLYLYHGARMCVSEEDEDGNSVNLFNDDYDAANYSHMRLIPTLQEIENILRGLMGSTGMIQYPVTKVK